jgi:hypothetical protein
MVHIHSIATSSQPSRQEQESGGEATSHFRAGRPRRGGGHSTATTRVDTAQRQRSASVAAVAPMAIAEATMHAVCQLLNNPPPSGASSSTVEQCRHDVDLLIIAAINSPPPRGNFQPPVRH